MIEKTGLLGRIYTVMEWITRMAYINILWILFTLTGLILFGIGPATVATFSIIRNWLRGNTDQQIFSSFWTVYKTEFLKANLLIWPLLIAGLILYIDFIYLSFFQGIVYIMMMLIFINAMIIYITVLLYIFPVYAHFEYKLQQNYSMAFKIGISSPFNTITMVISLFLIGLLFEQLPGLLPFFSVSIISLTISWFAHRAFLNIDKKKN